MTTTYGPITNVSNPRWADATNTNIIVTCDIPGANLLGVDFVASLSDVTSHGKDVHQAAFMGTFGPITAYAAPGPTWQEVQNAAQAALTTSDITILRCIEASIQVPVDWVNYRRALRSIISASTGNPNQALPTRPAYPAGT